MSGLRGRGFGSTADRGDTVSAEDVPAWFAGRLPDGWFVGQPRITVDRDEIMVIGDLPAGDLPSSGLEEAAAGRIRRFREETRDARITIAKEAEHRFGRKVAWGATMGSVSELFTTLSVPVMTRLRQPERQVLDTLVDSGVARSRSEALAWCVRLVGANTDSWLAQLREAMEKVEKIRAEGPRI